MVEFLKAPARRTREACERYGVPFTDTALLFEAADADRPAGECLALPQGDGGRLFIRTDGPSYLYDGLLRTALCALVARGIARATVEGELNEVLLRRLGFTPRENVWDGALSPDIFDCCGSQKRPEKKQADDLAKNRRVDKKPFPVIK